MTETDDHWRIGDLARATGVTVRTLHHYDELGLLVPSERTGAGYRLYAADDVRRLYRIVALRRLGLRLDEISALLEGGGLGLGALLDRQLDAVARQLAEARRLRARLTAIRDALDREDEPSIDDIIDTIEAMAMHEKYYTPEQLTRLDRRGEQLGKDAIEAGQQEWADLFATLRVELEAGTAPEDPRLDPIRAKAGQLVHAFSGGDAGIGASLRRMWNEEDPEQLSRGMLDRELSEYYRRVCAARNE